MRVVQIVFMFAALGLAIVAVWTPAQVWQLSITAVLLLIAAAGIEVSKMNSAKGDQQ